MKVEDELLEEAITIVKSIQLNYRRATEGEVMRLKEIACSLDYFRIYGERRGVAAPRVVCLGVSKTELVYRSCGVEGCQSPLPFYNLNKTRYGEAVWRCLAHIPPDMTFPIGLHGDEWAATGRTPVVWRAGR